MPKRLHSLKCAAASGMDAVHLEDDLSDGLDLSPLYDDKKAAARRSRFANIVRFVPKPLGPMHAKQETFWDHCASVEKAVSPLSPALIVPITVAAAVKAPFSATSSALFLSSLSINDPTFFLSACLVFFVVQCVLLGAVAHRNTALALSISAGGFAVVCAFVLTFEHRKLVSRATFVYACLSAALVSAVV